MILLLALMIQADEFRGQSIDAESALDWEASLLPEGFLYPSYLADPRAPVSGVRLQFPMRKNDDPKVETVIANHTALVRFGAGNEAFEVQVEAAAFSRFDISESLDMDGVDYRFGFPLVYRVGSVAVKLHPWHLTSHLGDEIAEREGRKRIAYARNEIAYGISWDMADEWRVYVEGGWGAAVGAPNRPWRWQGGVEFVDDLLGPAAPSVYVAMNVTSFQVTDWEPQFTLQAGLWLGDVPSRGGMRIGAEYFRGHSALTQFFVEHDHYWSFGVWVHF